MSTTPIPPNAPAGPIVAPPKSTGCLKYGLIGCGIATVLLGLVVVVVLGIAVAAIKSTDAYKEARTRATTDRRVIEALGSPVEAGFFVSGNAKVENRAGTAVMTFPISGPKGKATVRAEATLDGEGWHYSILQVERPNAPPINLLDRP